MATEAEAKKVIAEQRNARVKAQEEGTHKGKPTPTQDELDLHMLGVPLDKHEDDGSGPEHQLVLRREARTEHAGAAQVTPRPRPAQS